LTVRAIVRTVVTESHRVARARARARLQGMRTPRGLQPRDLPQDARGMRSTRRRRWRCRPPNSRPADGRRLNRRSIRPGVRDGSHGLCVRPVIAFIVHSLVAQHLTGIGASDDDGAGGAQPGHCRRSVLGGNRLGWLARTADARRWPAIIEGVLSHGSGGMRATRPAPVVGR